MPIKRKTIFLQRRWAEWRHMANRSASVRFVYMIHLITSVTGEQWLNQLFNGAITIVIIISLYVLTHDNVKMM